MKNKRLEDFRKSINHVEQTEPKWVEKHNPSFHYTDVAYLLTIAEAAHRFCTSPNDKDYRAMRTSLGLDNKIETTSGVIDLNEK